MRQGIDEVSVILGICSSAVVVPKKVYSIMTLLEHEQFIDIVLIYDRTNI